LGGLLVVAVVAVVVTIVATSPRSNPPAAPSPTAGASTVAGVEALLTGIPQAGITLGYASAAVTITEFSDLVCPACRYFATTAEPQLIKAEVRTGHAKLVSRGLETASSIANGGESESSQLAVRAAGLQNRACNYILLAYGEQPQMIGGKDPEDVAYVTPAYLQNLAAQIRGLNLIKWQASLAEPSLATAVAADARAAQADGFDSTPSFLISGANQSVRLTGAPTLAQLQAAMQQAG
jgi:protein-disulfide isomerase